MQRGDALDRSLGAGDRRVVRDLVHQRRAAQREAVGQRRRAVDGVEDELRFRRIFSPRPLDCSLVPDDVVEEDELASRR